jgi:mono/diheme cytochrome c family protein
MSGTVWATYYLGEFSFGVGKSSQTTMAAPQLCTDPAAARSLRCEIERRPGWNQVERSVEGEAIMKIKFNGLVKLGAAFAGLTLAATLLVFSVPARAAADDFDAAGTYKAKCFACHGAKAEKKFNAALSDSDMVQAILKGKKPEKPPNMPAFEERGITADQAKALVSYMKSVQ